MKAQFLTNLFVILILAYTSTALAETNRAERDKAFEKKCSLEQVSEENSESCMRYFRSLHKDKFSRKGCEENPSSELCQQKIERSEVESNRKRDTSSEREFKAFCKDNKDAPRCRKFTRQRAPRRSISSQIR